MVSYGPYRAIVIAEHDGDTVFLDVQIHRGRYAKTTRDLGFHIELRHDGVWMTRQSVRTLGDNAAELSTAAGKAALAYLQSILHIGDEVRLVSTGPDKYGGRIDGTITLPDGRDLTATMIAAGQAAPWDGTGAKPVPAG